MAVLAARGDYRYSSFAFYCLPDGEQWEFGANDELVRRVTKLHLVDVAPVADPAYWGTSVGLRDFDLDAIRASITTPVPPPGEYERSAVARLRSNPSRFGGGKETRR
jgi:phage head maturation protease